MRVLIVGVSSALGKKLAEEFKKSGVEVTGLARSHPEVTSYKPIVCDLLDPLARRDVIPKLLTLGPMDGVIFAQRYRGNDQWHGEFEVSVKATRDLIEGLANTFASTSIVMVSSVAGHMISLSQKEGYAAARGALLQLMKYYAVTLGPSGSRVNCISFNRYVKPGLELYHATNEESQRLAAMTPLRRLANSNDVIDGIKFLIDKSSSFISGHNLVLDGALSCVAQDSI